MRKKTSSFSSLDNNRENLFKAEQLPIRRIQRALNFMKKTGSDSKTFLNHLMQMILLRLK